MQATSCTIPDDAATTLSRVLNKRGRLSKRAALEAAFHLTDWKDDLAAFVRLLQTPAAFSDRDAIAVIESLLMHAPHHLNAAHRIVFDLPVTDCFELGAVRGTGKAKRRGGANYSKRSLDSPIQKPRRSK